MARQTESYQTDAPWSDAEQGALPVWLGGSDEYGTKACQDVKILALEEYRLPFVFSQSLERALGEQT